MIVLQNGYLQIADVGAGWAGDHQIRERREERIRIVVVEMGLRIQSRRLRALKRRPIDDCAGSAQDFFIQTRFENQR